MGRTRQRACGRRYVHPRNTLHCIALRTAGLCFILGLLSTDDQRASAGVLLWLDDDEQANNATTGGGGAPHGAIAAVEFTRVDVTGAGVALALRVAGVVRVFDVPGDLPGPIAGNNNVDSRCGGGGQLTAAHLVCRLFAACLSGALSPTSPDSKKDSRRLLCVHLSANCFYTQDDHASR